MPYVINYLYYDLTIFDFYFYIMYFFYLFIFLAMSILTFAAVIDLTIALENDGFVHSVMAFYFVSGEPYLKSGHGSGINYHDGIIHFACYIIILLAIDNRFVKFA